MKSHGSSRSSPPPAGEGEEKEQEKERGEERGIVFHHRNNYHKPGQKNEDESAPPSLLLSSLAHTAHSTNTNTINKKHDEDAGHEEMCRRHGARVMYDVDAIQRSASFRAVVLGWGGRTNCGILDRSRSWLC